MARIVGLPFSRLIRPWPWQRVRFLRTLLVVFGVLLFSAGIATGRLPIPSTWVLLLLAASWGALIALLWPPLAIIGIIPTTMLVGNTLAIGGGVNEPMLLIALLAGLWLLGIAAGHQRTLHLSGSNRVLLSLLAFLVAVVLAFGNGQLLWFLFADTAPMTAQLGSLGIFVLSAAAFMLVAFQLPELKWLRYMTGLFLLFGALFLAGRLVPALNMSRLLQRGAHGSVFWIWMVALALGQVLFNRELKNLPRFALAGLAALTIVVAFWQARAWASGWMPAVATAMVLLWLRSWRLGLFVTVLGIGVVLALNPGLIDEQLAADEYSISTRLVAWRIVLGPIAQVSPILGLGPANYYFYTPLFSILGWYVNFNSHNQYVDLIAQTGLLGLACFMWFAWEVGRLGLRLRAQAPDGFAKGYVYAALAGLVGTLMSGMFADWLLPFIYNIGFAGFRGSVMAWMFLGGLVTIDRLTRPGTIGARP